MGRGLNYALLYSCERSEAKELPFMSAFLFLWERKGFYLRSVAPSSPKPSLTPLHVQGGDIALLYEQSVAGFV